MRSEHYLTRTCHVAQASELIGQTVRCSQPAPFRRPSVCTGLLNPAFVGARAQSIRTHFTDDQLKEVINFVLGYFATLDIPVKRCVHTTARCSFMAQLSTWYCAAAPWS